MRTLINPITILFNDDNSVYLTKSNYLLVLHKYYKRSYTAEQREAKYPLRYHYRTSNQVLNLNSP